MRKLAIPLMLLGSLYAGETAVLYTGARLQADRVERLADRLVLHTAGGRIELDAALVERIDVDPEAKPVEVPDLVTEPPAPAPKSPRELVTEAALRYGLPPEFVHSVASQESAYQPKALSPKGAIGVMQLMPATAQSLAADPHDTAQNIDAGTRHLRDLLLRYQNEPNAVRKALAAYNAGAGAVQKYGGVPPYRETQNYVEKVIERYWKQVGGPPSSPP